MAGARNPIVIGVRADERSGDALALGAMLGRATGAPCLVACVYASGASGQRGLREQAQDAARQGAARLSGVGAVRAQAVAAPSPARGLHELAEVEGAAAIAIGCPHHGPPGRVLLGGVAERLLHGSPCAVAVAPRDARLDEVAVVGAAFVPTPEGHEALRAAADLAATAGARLQVLAAPHTAEGGADPARAAAAGERLRERLSEAVSGLPPALRAEPVVLEGDAAAALAEASDALDALVCGSRGYGPIGAVLLGGVSRRLLTKARCPVVVVPRGVPVDLGAGQEGREAAVG